MNESDKLKKGILPNLQYDIPSGFVVFLVAIPLCLGIALACEAPLISGIIAGLAGGLVIPFISRSPLSVSGPAAGLIAIVLSGIADLGGFQVFILAVFLSGIMQVILGFLRAGNIAYFFPSAVIKGMLAAIGLILILKQIPHALGYDVDYEGEMSFLQPDGENTFSEIWVSMSKTSAAAMIIAVVSLLILILWDRIPKLRDFRYIPGPLVAVLAGVGINQIFLMYGSELALKGDHLVQLPEFSGFMGFANSLKFPDFTALANPDVYVVAITLAIVGSMESLLSVEAVDRLDPWKRKSPLNIELIAQGAGNAVSGLLGGLPVTAVIVRSSANVNSGGRTRMASFVHGVFLFVSVLFFASILNLIPLSALAAILLTIGYKLARPSLFRHMFRLGWDQFIPFLVTVLAVLFTDLLTGIIIGIGVGIFFILKENFRSAIFTEEKEGETIIHFKKDLSFINKAKLVKTLASIEDGSRVRIIAERAEFIDYDLKEALDDFVLTAEDRNIDLTLEHMDELLEDSRPASDHLSTPEKGVYPPKKKEATPVREK